MTRPPQNLFKAVHQALNSMPTCSCKFLQILRYAREGFHAFKARRKPWRQTLAQFSRSFWTSCCRYQRKNWAIKHLCSNWATSQSNTIGGVANLSQRNCLNSMILRTKMTLTVSPFLLHILTRLGLQTKVHRSMRINKDSHSLLLYIMVSSSALAQGDGPLNATTSPVHRVSSPVRQRLNWSHRVPQHVNMKLLLLPLQTLIPSNILSFKESTNVTNTVLPYPRFATLNRKAINTFNSNHLSLARGHRRLSTNLQHSVVLLVFPKLTLSSVGTKNWNPNKKYP